MELTSSSYFSSHPSDSGTLSNTHSTSSSFNKEWQVNNDVNIEQWVAGVERKSNLSSSSLAAIDPTNLKTSMLSTHAQAPSNLDNSSNITGESCTIAFANSFPELFSSKLKLLDTGNYVGHPAITAAVGQAKADEDFTDFESHAIGNLLPDDEDDLLSGVTYDLDSMVPSHLIDEMEDFDLFSSGGGMELEGEVPYFNSQRNAEVWAGYPAIQAASMAGEHPYGEHPSRTLFVRNINSNVEDSELLSLFEQYGDIRTLYTACKHRGFVMISYYDIRAARSAMRSLQNKLLRRRKLDIHFSIPKDNPSDKDINQGTLVVFNLDASVSNDELRQIFGVYGEVKEIRETPHKRHHKFVEFYDVRSAEAALWALNRSDIAGKRIKLEPSRPGGARRSLMQQLSQELDQEEIQPQVLQSQSPGSRSPSGHPSHWAAAHSFGDVVPRSLHQIPAPLNLHASMHSPSNKSVPNLLPRAFSGKMGSIATHFAQHNEFEGSPLGSPNKQHHVSPHHSNSLPDFGNHAYPSHFGNSPSSMSTLRARDGAEGSRLQRSANSGSIDMVAFDRAIGVGGVSRDAAISNDSGMSLSGQQILWKNTSPFMHHPPNSSPIMWPNTSAASIYNHNVDPVLPRHHPFSGMLGHMGDTHHVGSAPSGRAAGMDAHHGYFANSPNSSSLVRSGSLGGVGMDPHATHALNIQASHGMMNLMANGIDLRSSSAASLGFLSPQQRARFASNSGAPGAFMALDGFPDRGRNRRGDASSTQAENKRQYQLDLDRILRGEDPRTTLMIKNIPNKYTVKMLLAAIDEYHRGTYDFIYLPIDFKNKCNVGYAFINMVDPLQIIPFYEAFNGKKWEKFNSEKVASLAYARIQGKVALIAHFQNSSLMNEDKRCRPIIFHTKGPNVGDQEPFPLGSNIGSRSSMICDNEGIIQPRSPSGSSSNSKDEDALGAETSEPATNPTIP